MDISPLIIWFEANPDKIKDGVSLEPWEYVTDGKSFVTSHIETLKLYGGRPRYRVYYERLSKYWKVCQDQEENKQVLRKEFFRGFCNRP